MDRIDLHVEVPGLSYAELSGAPGESSAAIRERVSAARAEQASRNPGGCLNARLAAGDLRRWALPEAEGRRLLEHAVDRLGLTARAHDRVLRVARTLADLAGEARLSCLHVAEALSYRETPESLPELASGWQPAPLARG